MHIADKSLVTCSYDCTVRFWSVESGNAERVFKFSDPIMTTLVDPTRDFLFTGSWDKSVKAIDLKTGEVDRSFIASEQAVLSMLLYDKWLFVSGQDPVVRVYNLEKGDSRLFEGHTSWVLCMKTYITYKEDGSVDK